MTTEVHPHVELLACTPDAGTIVASAAKLCYSDADINDLVNKMSGSDTDRFLDKLTAMGHLSPIEHATFTFGVEGVSRAFLAQITRHRIASFSVKSQRYVNAENFNYVTPPAIAALGEEARARYAAQMEQMSRWYAEWNEALGNKGESSNEDARFVLPNAAETKLIVTMNARELMHFFTLRCCNRAQWEIREVAWQMFALAFRKAPYLFRCCGPSCLRGACSEGRMCCGRSAEVRARYEELTKE
ncbi:MAG: FAD-dependent thymidylate synthase [Eubacteriales bacterium]|nr:FAD-dependent thymidylate synthase [Eubacteriales bacterium]